MSLRTGRKTSKQVQVSKDQQISKDHQPPNQHANAAIMLRRTGYEFLDDMDHENDPEGTVAPHTTAPWLHSDFDEPAWEIQAASEKAMELDWSVVLWNDSVLTDPENDVLLRSLKHLLIIGANGVNQEFSSLAPQSMAVKISYTLKLIDYLLINAKDLGLVDFGLGDLDSDSLKGILNNLSKSAWSEESIYAWRERASAFCATELSKLTKSIEDALYAKYPSMLVVSDDGLEDMRIDVAASDIPRLRAALMHQGMYYGNSNQGYRVSSKAISSRIYTDTLRGRQTMKSALEVLAFYPHEQAYKREFPGVRVTTGEAISLCTTTYHIYRYTLIGSAALGTLGLPSPTDIDHIADYVPQLSTPARFRSVPSANLLKLFRKSMEFHVEHGRKILNGFIRVAAHCQRQNTLMSHLTDAELQQIIGPELVELGVRRLGLSSNRRSKQSLRRKSSKEKYFQSLRDNRGLLELVYVYLGSIQLTVGTIMARRVDELLTLDASKCLDASKSWLMFNLAKSSRRALGIRQRESRPIDAIAVEMIEELRRFQRLLKRFGVIDGMTDLFATPSSLGFSGLQDCTIYLYNRHLDFACDYFESDLNAEGQRYYVRQHQLRRFFAIMFFYTNSFGELDTLRWMLGHRDIEHVWHYLTECLEPGDIRAAGARYFTDLAKNDRLENYQTLQELLATEFGTTSFKLVDEKRIEDYLQAMLEEGKARIEPHFFNDESGQAMKVLFIVS